MGALLKVIHLCSLDNNVQHLILVYLFSIHCSFTQLWFAMKVNMWHYVWSNNSRDCISPMSKIFSEAHLSFWIFCGTRWTNEPQKLSNKCFFVKKMSTFLVRIRATRRAISEGHQFSPKAFIAEHSSLCTAQSPFYTNYILFWKGFSYLTD